MSFVDRILGHGRENPSAPALSVSDRIPDIVTYGVLNRCIANVCRKLKALGIAPGRLYGLHIDDDLLYVAMTYALEYLGAATVVAADPERLDGWPIAGIFSMAKGAEWPFPVEVVDRTWLEGNAESLDAAHAHATAPEGLCCVSWTSGSTGRPKGIPLTHRLAALRAAQFDHRFGPEYVHQSRIFSAMGFSSGWGYHLLNHTLSRGGLLCLRPQSLEEAIRKFSAYRLQATVASPLYLADFTVLSRNERRNLQSLQVVVSSGGMLRDALAENIRNGICSRLVNSYGSVEAGAVANAPVEMLDLDKGETGFIVPGVDVEIIDPQGGERISEGVGRVRIRSACVAPGYIGPHKDDGRLRGDIFYSGDLGTLSPRGLLSILGRDSNVVNLGGPKTTLELIEASYARAPGVLEVASMLSPDPVGVDKLVAFIVPSDRWSERDFWDHCRAKIASEFWPTRLVVVPHLPRIGMGKVDRQGLAAFL
jgi:acyl-coenzyme A synthetase/AMP-(fatty) acid ligase